MLLFRKSLFILINILFQTERSEPDDASPPCVDSTALTEALAWERQRVTVLLELLVTQEEETIRAQVGVRKKLIVVLMKSIYINLQLNRSSLLCSYLNTWLDSIFHKKIMN